MIAVIPYGVAQKKHPNNSLPEGEELRYCLRGVEMYLPFVTDVFIAGKPPVWCKCKTINVRDYTGLQNKELNIFRKICKAFDYMDEMVFLNDDHFLLKEMVSMPYFYSQALSEEVNRHPLQSSYRITLENTIKQIGESAMYYDVHTPIVYQKDAFLKLRELDWTVPFGYCIKTMYCNVAPVEGVQMEDLKISEVMERETIDRKIGDRFVFSTGDNCFGNSMKAFLNERYPNKSKWER